MNIEDYFSARQQRINSVLQTVLPSPTLAPQHLHDAMHYAVLNGGKRLRPILVYATGEAFGTELSILDYPASAIELIHAYSLVHDDLPAMDDDDLRRGKPTCHKAFDEATAILVGDALQALAFTVLSDHDLLPASLRLAMVSTLAFAAGSMGMAGGQALDLKATGGYPSAEEVQTIHHLKTGALFTACVKLGLLCAQRQDAHLVDTLVRFASAIGLCFQIQDDILNAEGSTTLLGKEVGSDLAKQKATYATISGIENAKDSLHHFYRQALEALQPLGDKGVLLRELAHYIVHREY